MSEDRENTCRECQADPTKCFEHKDPTPDQVNKYLAERMGELGCDGYKTTPHKDGELFTCDCGLYREVRVYKPQMFEHIATDYPDYHTAPGFFKLLEYMKGRGKDEAESIKLFKLFCAFAWLRFFEFAPYAPFKEIFSFREAMVMEASLPLYFIDPTTFPTLCAEWLKGGER